ncbi:MAG TPA: GFA family protein, partial [Baekduia sp.]|nr:GFA family protein [Baekduia sp.]
GHVKCFCELCGGHLWSRDPAVPGVYSIRLGAFDGDPGIRPAARQFTAYAAVWEPIPDDGLPRYPERVPRGDGPGAA